jgi:hypothetical protein
MRIPTADEGFILTAGWWLIGDVVGNADQHIGKKSMLRLAPPVLKHGIACPHNSSTPYCIVHQYERGNAWAPKVSARYSTIRTLIAINSWVKGATNGENQAIRDTFLKDVPELEYRFFIGDGTPTGDDETGLQHSMDIAHDHYKIKHANNVPEPFDYIPEEDEIVLHVPDDYLHLTYKTRENIRWALAHGFDFVFQCFSDTFIDIQRLLASGYENYDYSGRQCTPEYASGGSGYWLSKKVMQLIANQPVTDWADDRWIGSIATKNGIVFHIDARYSEYPDYPSRNNTIITSHLAGTPVIYNPQQMYQIYKMSLLSLPRSSVPQTKVPQAERSAL